MNWSAQQQQRPASCSPAVICLCFVYSHWQNTLFQVSNWRRVSEGDVCFEGRADASKSEMMPGVLKHWKFSIDSKGEVIARIAVIKNSHKINYRENFLCLIRKVRR